MKTLWDLLVENLGYDIQPSPQQQAVWKAMAESTGRVQTIQFTAFNRSIVADFQGKWSWAIEELRKVGISLSFSTMHSMGFKAVNRAFDRVDVQQHHVSDLVAEILGKDIWELRRQKPTVLKAVCELVGLCKMNLTGHPGRHNYEQLGDLATYYDVDLNGESEEVFGLVPRVLDRCKEVDRDHVIDYDDMIWLPVALNLNVYKYDLLLCDELQDFNLCQQALAKKAGRRIIGCGDPKQAIYGFAGADAQAMTRFERELSATERGCIHLPLTVTRRCGKAIVREAQKYVPDFDFFEGNPEGKITQMEMKGEKSYQPAAQDGDMVLSRVNAPLVSECFKFLRAGRKANIQGRDVGSGLISTIKKVLKAKEEELHLSPVEELIQRIQEWLSLETRREQVKRNPSDSRIIALQDRHDCIVCFTEGARTAKDVADKINSLFTDEKNGKGIRLSSIHRAKGLEADRVFFINSKEAPCPHPMARTALAKEQEANLCYVGITRARNELVWVS